MKTQINWSNFEQGNCAQDRRLAAPFFLSLFFVVTCLLWRESSLSLSLFLFSWHSWWGKSRIPNKVQRITYSGRYFGCLTATVGAMSQRQKQKREMTYAADLEMCVTSSILSLTGSLCFKCMSRPCTQRSDPAKEFLPASQWDGLCGANLICGLARTIRGFEQICCAPEPGDEEEQHRGEWGLCELLKICRALAGCHKTRPCRQNRMVNHYISAPKEESNDFKE